MRRYGVPVGSVDATTASQFTGRFIKPLPVEVLFEKICRDNGIKQRLTKPRSPTTTGKIERFHKTLREEFLDHVAPFESIAAAQEAVDAWVHAYNHQRPHQALDMAVPASLFDPTAQPASTPPTGQASSLSRRHRHWSSTSSSHPANYRQPVQRSSSRCACHPAATSRSAPGASRCRSTRAWPAAR